MPNSPSYMSVFYQDAEPTPRQVGDFWITDTGDATTAVIKQCVRIAGSVLWTDVAGAGLVGTADITDLAVTTAKLAAGAATPPKLGLAVWNATGSPIVADKIVATSGLDTASGTPLIVLADADVAAHDDLWVTTAAIADGAAGVVYRGATSAATLNTNSATTAGDPVYLSTTAGGFAHTAPTTAISRVQPVGFVIVKSATVGQILWVVGPVRMIGTNELQLDAVTNVILADMTRGTVKVGGASNVPTDYNAKTSGQILVGDGTDILSVAVSGDATLAASGALTIAASAVTSAKVEADLLRYVDVQLTNAEVLALRAAPKTLLASPGANRTTIVDRVLLVCSSAAGAYTESSDNLAIEYADGTDILVVETTGFVDQGAVSVRVQAPNFTVATPIAASAIQLFNNGDGEFGGGNAANTLSVRLWYSIADMIAFS